MDSSFRSKRIESYITRLKLVATWTTEGDREWNNIALNELICFSVYSRNCLTETITINVVCLTKLHYKYGARQ